MFYYLIPALALASCSASRGEPGKSQDRDGSSDHSWTKLHDGSYGWLEKSPVSEFANEQAERCWPVNGAFDCLKVSTLVKVGDLEKATVSVTRYAKVKLQDSVVGIGDDKVRGGYSCQSISGKMIVEGIFRVSPDHTEQDLQVNRVLLGQRDGGVVWSPDFVVKFIRENGVTATLRYVDCLNISTIVQSDSLAAINTTALSYGMMTGRDDATLYGSEGRKENP